MPPTLAPQSVPGGASLERIPELQVSLSILLFDALYVGLVTKVTPRRPPGGASWGLPARTRRACPRAGSRTGPAPPPAPPPGRGRPTRRGWGGPRGRGPRPPPRPP